MLCIINRYLYILIIDQDIYICNTDHLFHNLLADLCLLRRSAKVSSFCEVFAFFEDAPDVIGASAVRDGRILAMAGASCDSPAMWQIGINVEPDIRYTGIGKMLAALLKNEILRRGILPFYGISLSHIGSQRAASGAGFVPARAELATSKQANHAG